MVDFYLLIENSADESIKIFNYYFRYINFKHEKNLKNNDTNIVLVKKNLFAVKDYQKNLKNVMNKNEVCYLSKCKNIIYLPAKTYNVETNKLTFSESIGNYNIIFENTQFCPIDNIKFKEIDNDIYKIYYNYQNNKRIIYDKNFSIKNINTFIDLEYKEKKFYCFLIIINDKNYIDVLNKIKQVKYFNCRFIIINKIKNIETDSYIKKQLFLLYKKKYCISLFNIKLNIINNILLELVLPFENLVFYKTHNYDFKPDEYNKILDFYKIYLDDQLIIIPTSYYLRTPIFKIKNNNFDIPSNYKLMLNNISIFNEKEIYCKNKDKFKIFFTLPKIPMNYKLIEEKMNLSKDYNNLINILDEHIKNVKNNSEYYETIIRKVTILVLTSNESSLNEEMVNIINLIEDEELLQNIFLFINNTKFANIKETVLFKLLHKLKDDDKKFLFYLVQIIKLKISSKNVIKLFELINQKKELIIKSFKIDSFLNNLFNIILANESSKNSEIIDKFNEISIAFSNNDFKNLSIEEQIEYYKKINIKDFLICIHLISHISNFDPYYKSYDDFLVARDKIYNNFLNLKNIFNFNINLENIQLFPLNNFYLSYQGLPSKDIFILKNQIYKSCCPLLNYKIDTNFKNEKIKVLFHAHHINRIHSVYKDRHQVIANLSLDPRFDVYFSTFEDLKFEVKFTFGKAKHIKLPFKLDEIQKKLSQMKLDIIVYCEIGMFPLSYWMACMKLAKIQCNTWGHSDTSGIDTIDYFFSSKLYELPYEESQTHYSEKLILQNSLCTSYVNPLQKHNIKNFKNRLFFGLTDDSVIYFCAQSLFKINPLYDEYIVKILQNVPNSLIVFLDGDSKTKILERLNNKNIGSQIKFFPGMSHFGYLNLMNCCDIILDIYPFGGCNSSFEAFSLNKVIVTQPSIMINGRFTLGFYKKMGLEEYVCNTKEEYIDFAIKLGKDKEYRQTIEKKISEKKDCLFLDKETLQEWKDDLIKIYEDYENKNQPILQEKNITI
jgi:hypothetical protein